MTMNKRQYDIMYSLQRYLKDITTMRVDLVFDGYIMHKDRPLITIEQMQNNLEYITKLRESVSTDYRFQVGLHASNPVEKMKLQEVMIEALIFGDVPYFRTSVSIEDSAGIMSVKVMAVVPMPSDDIAQESGRHTVYFDVEIDDIKRRCI